MRIDRRVVARKDQLLVPIPARLRDHLRLVPTQRVYWHISRRGVASLTVSGRVRGGRPREDADCPTCVKYRDELDRLRRETRAGEAATPGQWWRQGYMQSLEDLGNIQAEVRLVLAGVKQLLAEDRRRRPGRAGSSGQSRGAAQPRTSNPRPDPLPSPSSGGADASGAASPQASQPEVTVQYL